VLQLHAMNRESDTSSELIAASIEQKTKKIQPVPFVEAIDLKKNRQYLRYALPPLVFIVCGLVIYPSFIVAPSKRLIRHNEVFERPAPFSIAVLNDKLQAVQQDDYTLNVKVIGDKIPAQLFVEIEKTNYKMERESNSLYHFVFKNIQRNTPFVINAEEYNSKEYVLKVLPKPTILSFDVEAEYPAYLHRKNETFVNTGDLNIPIGSKLTWKFYTRDTKAIMFRMGGKLNELKADKSNTFVQSERMMVGSPYSISSRNEFFLSKDSLAYLINVIPDLYPSITVEEIKDSVFDNRFYFQGNVKDDYGLSKLVFAWKTKKTGEESSSTGNLKTKEIVIDKSKLEQQFFYFLDMTTLFVQPGDEVQYYFEVWDNDGVNGNKSTRSAEHIFKVPTLEELEKQTNKKGDDIKDKMESMIKQSKSLQNQVDDLDKKMIDKKEVGWQEMQTLKQLLEKQKSLQEQVKELQKENKEKNLQENQYKDNNDQLMEKQKQLEDLFNKVMTEDMKKMYDELQKMLEKVDKDKVAEMLDKIKDDSKNLERELDRNLELFKQLEVEKRLEQAIEKLDKLSQEQSKLSDETKEAPKDNVDKLEKKEEEIKDQFRQLKDDIKELQKKNSELEEPNKLENTDSEQKEIDKDIENSSEELKSGSQQKASKSQKSASEKMKSLSSKLSKMQQEMESDQESEDAEALRQILDNLVKISFDQEEIMNQLKVVSTTNPKYLKIIQSQKNLKDDIRMVADSLYSVSKRQAKIEPFIMREMTAVEKNVDNAVSLMNSRNNEAARAKQQYAMT